MFAAAPSALLSTPALERRIHESLLASGLNVIALPTSTAKPFRYAIHLSEPNTTAIMRIHAWNITHGGGRVRSSDEFRIQLTGMMPSRVPGEITAILGWSESHGVFVAWDPDTHDHRTSVSPSLQVRESVMSAAAANGVAAAERASGDAVVAFRPELLAAYCLSIREAHDDESPDADAASDTLPLTTPEMGTLRPRLEKRLEIACRAWDFARRVLVAYGRRCGVCGVGLGLVEGAHIVPVAWPGSTDETKNGLALCRNHHAAYDRALINVTSQYRVEVARELDAVTTDTESVDAAWLREFDGASLCVLPINVDERPDPRYLEIGQRARGWSPP